MEYLEPTIEIDFAGHRGTNMNITKIMLSGAALLALSVPVAFARIHDHNYGGSDHATINQRKENQQDRIANGVNSGRAYSPVKPPTSKPRKRA